MKKNFLFDLDQTLLNFHASERKALEIVLTANGIVYTDEVCRYFEELNKSLWLKLETQEITRQELFETRFNDVLSRYGKKGKLNALKVNDEFINTMAKNGVLMVGALEFVKKIKTEIKDSRIYIVSNGATVNAEGRIKTTGLEKYIDKLFISEAMGVAKPAVEFFDIVFNQIKEPKESCIMIGDSLTSDMLGAKNAGLNSIWFMPQGTEQEIKNEVKEYEIDFCARDYKELFQVLKKWSER